MRHRSRFLFATLVLTSACELVTGAGDLTLRSGTASPDASASADATSDGATGDGSTIVIDDAASDVADGSDGGDGSVALDCRAAGCDAKASCALGDAGIACFCPTGYTTPDNGRTCTDIDECAGAGSTLCGSGSCRNTIGSFACDCPMGGCQIVYATFGAYQFRVPGSVSSISVDLWGGGGGASTANTIFGGGGGYTFGNIAVVAGAVFDVRVGGGGPAGLNPGTTTTAFGGGGSGKDLGGGGGGRSEIAVGSTLYLVAGGGGGGGYMTGSVAGPGGGDTGVDGSNCPRSGLGGTQTAGGPAGGGALPGTAGAFGTGGNGGKTSGGGGGGYFGGGGGGGENAFNDGCSGGGGSGYVRGTAPVSVGMTTAGSGTSPGGTSRPTWGGSAGKGGSGPQFTSQQAPGAAGRVVITWQ